MHPCPKHNRVPYFHFATHSSRARGVDLYTFSGCPCAVQLGVAEGLLERAATHALRDKWDALQLANFEQHTALWTEPERMRWRAQLFGGYAEKLKA